MSDEPFSLRNHLRNRIRHHIHLGGHASPSIPRLLDAQVPVEQGRIADKRPLSLWLEDLYQGIPDCRIPNSELRGFFVTAFVISRSVRWVLLVPLVLEPAFALRATAGRPATRQVRVRLKTGQ